MKRLKELKEMSRSSLKSSLKSSLAFVTGQDKVPTSTSSGGGSGGEKSLAAEPGKAVGLPWEPQTPEEIPLERELRSKILKLSQSSEPWLEEYRENEKLAPEEAIERASEILKVDENLRKIRFELVPKVVNEEEFWVRYFAAVHRLRCRLVDEAAKAGEGQDGETEDEVERACQALRSATVAGGGAASPDGDGRGSKLGRLEVSAKQLRHMARALETARGYRRMDDLSDAGKPSTTMTTKTSGWRHAVARRVEAGRNMLARKMSAGGKQERLVGAVWDLFDPEDARVTDWDLVMAFFPSTAKLIAQVPAASPTGFLAHLSSCMGKMGTMAEMSELWAHAIEEITWHFRNLKPIPRVPRERSPDLQSCPLQQKLMLLNNCIARKARFLNRRKMEREAAAASEERVALPDGTKVQRRGHKSALDGKRMLLVPDEVIWVPETQEEGSVLTEELIREQEDLISKTGTIGPGLQQLLFDMEAFKAANPGGVLEDFVRWYSPADWVERDGQEPELSSRMKEPGNMWTELFAKAKATPASKQNPLFDFDYHGEMTIESLAQIAPSDLFEQLFIVSVCVRHALLEEEATALKEAEPESKVMAAVSESEEFSVTTVSRGMGTSKLEKICAAYETVEDFISGCAPREHVEEEESLWSDYHETPWGI